MASVSVRAARSGIGSAVGDLGVQQGVGFFDPPSQPAPEPIVQQARVGQCERRPRAHVEQPRHDLAQRGEPDRIAGAYDGPQDHLKGDLRHLGRHRERLSHRPPGDVGGGNLGYRPGLARDRVAMERRRHQATPVAVHVVVDQQQ